MFLLCIAINFCDNSNFGSLILLVASHMEVCQVWLAFAECLALPKQQKAQVWLKWNFTNSDFEFLRLLVSRMALK